MDVSQLQQMIGMNVPLRSHHPHSKISPEEAVKPKQPDALKNNTSENISHLNMDDPELQKSTVSYLNKLLKFHGIGMHAKISNFNGQTYVAFNDVSTGDLIKRLKMEDVINGLTFGQHSMVDFSV